MKSFRLVFTALSAMALVALLVGCGKTTSPTAVTTDSSAPAAPTSLSTTVDQVAGSATLHWAESQASDIQNYTVYAYAPSPDREESYLQVGSTTDTQFTIPMGYNQGHQYFRVLATNTGGNNSALSAALQVSLPYLNGSGGGSGSGSGGGGKGTRGD